MHSLITPHPSGRFLRALRRSLPGALLLLVSIAQAADASPAPRLTGTFEGIECEYSPGQEELARLLAARFARHNQEYQTALSAKGHAQSQDVPLSPAEMRANRAVYLGRIAALLALKQPTALQEECYDAFLENYEQTMGMFGRIREVWEELSVIHQFVIWERGTLKREFEASRPVKGFTYDPSTKSWTASYGRSLSFQDDRTKELAEQRQKLHLQYKMGFEIKDGVTTYRGSVGPKVKKPHPAQPKDTQSPPKEAASAFPVVVPGELTGKTAEEQAATVWDGRGEKSLVQSLAAVSRLPDQIPRIDPQIALMVLHETIELGIVDHYFHGPDRRWFCDGVANYGAWRVLRDLHGEELANRTHNLSALLQQYASLREQADLRKWPATEHQSEAEQQTPLNAARYIFAERAVALMDERGGQDILPHLFEEIGKTKPKKVSMKTVEKAWQKLTGGKLDAILADAVAPQVAASSASPNPASHSP